MNPLSQLLELPHAEKVRLGAVYTPAEIAGQAALWPDTAARVLTRRSELASFLEGAGIRGERHMRPSVTLIGAGTSDYIGRCLTSLLRGEWQCDVEAVASTSMLAAYEDGLLPERPRLWISFSRSGNSPEGVAVLQRALSRNPEVAHLVITCNADGEMARQVQGRSNCLAVVLGEATNDKGLAMTGSFTNMVVCGQALAHLWRPEPYAAILDSLCTAAAAFLPVAAQVAHDLALQNLARACFLGTGPLAGVAAESALKLLELTAGRMKTMSETTLGLRHGPMSAIDDETLIVQFLSTDPTRRRYEVDILREIEAKRLTPSVVAVNGATECLLHDLNTTRLLAPAICRDLPDAYRPPVDVLFGQCLGLFSSLRHSLCPDTPSPNGAITRVVPAFTIY